MENEVKCKKEMFYQPNGERIPQREWKSIAVELPLDKSCVEFASHNYYGLANWSKEKGFYEVFLTAGPFEEAEYYRDPSVWNSEVMWWRPIPQWPYYGATGYDAESMKEYISTDL